MSAPSDAQIGHVEEDTFGVFKAPTTFNPTVSFDHGFALERLESEGVVAGLDIIGPDQWNGGNITIEPEIGFELYTAGLGIWLKHMFGAQSGAGPYEFTPGDIDSLPGLSIQAGVPRVSGAVVPVGLSGCRVTEWELAAEDGQIATLGLSLAATGIHFGTRSVADGVVTNGDATVTSATAAFTAADIGAPISGTNIPAGTRIASVTSATEVELSANATGAGTGVTLTIGAALASATYGAGSTKPLKFTHAALSLGGSSTEFSGITIAGSNALKTDRRTGGSAFPLAAKREGRREFTASVSTEYVGPAAVRALLAGSTAALVLNFQAGSTYVKIEGNVRYDEAGPGTVDGKSIVEEELGLKFVRSGSTLASAIKATVTAL